MEFFTPSTAVVLSLQLDDGVTSQYPQAVVRVAATGFVEATVNLVHVGSGLYTASWSPATNGPYQVAYTVYNDAAHTTPNTDYGRVLESWSAELPASTAAAAVDAGLARKLLKNRLELSDGSSANHILYDDDGVTPLVVWDVQDKAGGPINVSLRAPAKRRPQ